MTAITGVATAQTDNTAAGQKPETEDRTDISRMAEEPAEGTDKALSHFDDSALQRIMPTRYGGRSRKYIREETHTDSLNLPAVNQYGQPQTIGHYPLAFGGWYSWGLH